MSGAESKAPEADDVAKSTKAEDVVLGKRSVGSGMAEPVSTADFGPVLPPVLPNGPLTDQVVAEFIAAAKRFAYAEAPSLQRSDVELHLASLRRVPKDSCHADLADILRRLAYRCYTHGWALLGLEPAVQALRLAQEVGHPALLSRCHGALAVVLNDVGDWYSVALHHGASLEWAERGGETLDLSMARDNLALALIDQGRPTDAIAVASIAYQVEDYGDRQEYLEVAKAGAAFAMAEAFAQLEDYEAAMRWGQQAIEHADRNSGPLTAAYLRTVYRAYCAKNCVYGGALETARKLLQEARSLPHATARADLCVGVAEALLLVLEGRPDAGIARLVAVLDESRIARASVPLALQALAWANRHQGRAAIAEIYERELHALREAASRPGVSLLGGT